MYLTYVGIRNKRTHAKHRINSFYNLPVLLGLRCVAVWEPRVPDHVLLPADRHRLPRIRVAVSRPVGKVRSRVRVNL